MNKNQEKKNIDYKNIEKFFFAAVLELIENSKDEQEALVKLEDNLELFKRYIINDYEEFKKKDNNENAQKKPTVENINSLLQFPNMIL